MAYLISRRDFLKASGVVALSLTMTNAFSGCASTKPNIPFSGKSYPKVLKGLNKKNPLLVLELGKLPEIQDGVSEEDNAALEVLVEIYNENPEVFDKVFKKMFQIGVPEVRQYCSPLQALFWLSEDMRYEAVRKNIYDYSLSALINESWEYNTKDIKLTVDDIRYIVENTKNKNKKSVYQSYLDIEVFDALESMILHHIKQNPTNFSEKVLFLIDKKMMNKHERERWSDFTIVTNRLNSPQLVHYYLRLRTSYIFDHVECQTPRRTFNRKMGCCVCMANFGGYCLDKAGYSTFIRHLRSKYRQHGVLVVKQGKKYLIAVDYNGSNRISGPFDTIAEVDAAIFLGRAGTPYLRRYLQKKY